MLPPGYIVSSVCDTSEVFISPPTNRRNTTQGLFKVGPGAGLLLHTRPAVEKIPQLPSAFPSREAPQAPGNKRKPSKEGLSLWGRPPEARGKSSAEILPTRTALRTNTAGQSATQQME